MKLQFNAIGRKLAKREEPPADLLRVAGWLAPRLFLLQADASVVAEALRVAANAIAPDHGIDPVLVFDALWRREQAASTALGAGFAIPHARLPGIPEPLTVFVRLRQAIPFGATDGEAVRYLLVILVPKDGADGDHLTMLSLIAQLFSQPAFRKQIARATDPATARAVFAGGIANLLRTAPAS